MRRSRLSDPALRGLLVDLLGAERAVRSAADHCSTELYERIGATVDEDVRRRLVDVRRAIHNDRVPRIDLAMDSAAVSRWLTARDRRQAVRDEIIRVYSAAAGRERSTLAALLGDEDLLCALILAAPEVYDMAQRYRFAVASDGAASTRARKAERGLIQYVTRAMVRTSPLSRFTAVGIAVPDADAPSPSEMCFAKAVAFPELDRVMLGYVLGGLPAMDGADLMDAWLGLPPTSNVDVAAGKLIFLRWTEEGLQRLTAPLTASVELLLDATGMGPRPPRSVVAHIVARTGCRVEDAEKIIHAAVRQNILCSYNQPEDGGADLADLLTRPDFDLLVDIKSRLARFGAAPVGERADELDELRSTLASVSHVARRPARITVEEDYVIPPMRVATEQWQRPLDDLAAVVELLSAFDWLHDVRVLMAAAFVARFGAGANVSLTEHANFIAGEVSRRAAAMSEVYGGNADVRALAEIGPPTGCLEQLHQLRQQVTEVLHAAIAKAVDSGEDITLSTSDVIGLVAGMPARFRQDPLIYGVLVQHWQGRLIFNDGLPGHGMLYGRFLAADQRLGGNAASYLAERLTNHYGTDGFQVVEDFGLHNLNVNAHRPVLPGLQPDDWYSLRLVHDPESDMLRVETTDGAKLRVLPLGTGHPGLFPPPLSVASGLVISGRLVNGLPNSWHTASPWDRRKTRMIPRMSVGDVVVARRRWYGGEELAKAVTTGPAEHDRLLALTAWRSTYDVPEEVLIKTIPEDEGPMSVVAAAAMSPHRRLQQKPQYVDLASALSTRVLPRMLDRRMAVDGPDGSYLEEALPKIVDGTHASEWVVEVGRRPGGPFQYGPSH